MRYLIRYSKNMASTGHSSFAFLAQSSCPAGTELVLVAALSSVISYTSGHVSTHNPQPMQSSGSILVVITSSPFRLDLLEHVFGSTALRAYPIFRKFFKRCSYGDTPFRVPLCGVVNIITYSASISLHFYIPKAFLISDSLKPTMTFPSMSKTGTAVCPVSFMS